MPDNNYSYIDIYIIRRSFSFFISTRVERDIDRPNTDFMDKTFRRRSVFVRITRSISLLTITRKCYVFCRIFEYFFPFQVVCGAIDIFKTR